MFLFISILQSVFDHDGDHKIVNGQKIKRNNHYHSFLRWFLQSLQIIMFNISYYANNQGKTITRSIRQIQIQKTRLSKPLVLKVLSIPVHGKSGDKESLISDKMIDFAKISLAIINQQ